MKGKFLKRGAAIILSAVMLLGCVPSAFAVVDASFVYDPGSDSSKDELFFTPGEVLVGVTEDAETMNHKEMLSYLEEFLPPEFKIVDMDLYWAYYTNEDGTEDGICHNVWCIEFEEKSKEIVWKAIDILSKSPYVYFAQPDYNASVHAYAPDEVIVYLNKDYEDCNDQARRLGDKTLVDELIKELFPEYKFTRTDVYLRSESDLKPGYGIRFEDKNCEFVSCEFVWNAIDILKASPYVLDARPMYYAQCDGRWTDDNPKITFPYVDKDNKNTEDTNSMTEPTDTVTDVNGGGENTKTDFVKGDADGDGELSVKDATCIQMYLANLISEQKINCSAANVSGTGTVTINDATMIQMQLAGLLNAW
ncbi:MAG: dockerin type I repeat-containing protein [Ruminococcus sp.]|nr:dockerin type I repeat-containing protein [Ruminococcus sp.]